MGQRWPVKSPRMGNLFAAPGQIANLPFVGPLIENDTLFDALANPSYATSPPIHALQKRLSVLSKIVKQMNPAIEFHQAFVSVKRPRKKRLSKCDRHLNLYGRKWPCSPRR